ncbi:hypothetical protein A2U01_0069394 [Trifolium medium]|uniref:Uncharacterized protein n=1 Tax=Trifolium medium TaxID=97028 RepID=A0A392SH04_9FABA|nr:hypothetical protein [Trifolium medium]
MCCIGFLSYDHHFSSSLAAKSSEKVVKFIKWQSPSLGWVRLNTDGPSKVI